MGYTCSVVIPVYNSQATLRELVTRIGKVMPQLSDKFEVILVNDGSRDQSWTEICALAQEYPWARGINMMRNYGQHNALLCGLRAAKYEITITMDDDLQHPPEEIGALLGKFCDDFDVVYGIPKKLPHSLWRNFFSLLTKRLLAFVTNIPTVQYAGSFRALRTELREAFATFQSPNVILDVLLSWGTTRFTFVQVEESPREVGNSNYNFVTLFSHAMSILIGFSTAPLRLASMIGFAFHPPGHYHLRLRDHPVFRGRQHSRAFHSSPRSFRYLAEHSFSPLESLANTWRPSSTAAWNARFTWSVK